MRVVFNASRVLAVFACLATVAGGLPVATLGASLTCFDSCPSREQYFSHIVAVSERILIPCVVLQALALAAFVSYCLATRQVRRALKQFSFTLGGGAIGIAALGTVFWLCTVSLNVSPDDTVAEASAVEWMVLWGFALSIVAGSWSGLLARMQWSSRDN
jgi:hypothetical protein